MSRRDRIRARLMRSVVVDEVTGCWLWIGPTSGTSGRGRDYPRVCIDGATMAAHRAMWIVEHGPIPPRKQLDHVCRRRLCIRPDSGHNEMVTHLRNQRRRADAARSMRCDDTEIEAGADGPAADPLRGDRGAADARRPVPTPSVPGQAGPVPQDVGDSDRRPLLLSPARGWDCAGALAAGEACGEGRE